MAVIPLTRGMEAIVDDEDFECLNQWKWHVMKGRTTYYVTRDIRRKIKPRHIDTPAMIFMHRLIMDVPQDKQIDHKNHNGLDNRKNNLRICTRSQNLRNKINGWGKYSKFLCVSKIVTGKRKKRWVADITIENKLKRIGYFYTEIEASKAFEAFKKENFDMGI